MEEAPRSDIALLNGLGLVQSDRPELLRQIFEVDTLRCPQSGWSPDQLRRSDAAIPNSRLPSLPRGDTARGVPFQPGDRSAATAMELRVGALPCLDHRPVVDRGTVSHSRTIESLGQ